MWNTQASERQQKGHPRFHAPLGDQASPVRTSVSQLGNCMVVEEFLKPTSFIFFINKIGDNKKNILLERVPPGLNMFI